MREYKRIFIIGHPGAGKGLVAKTIAEKLGWKFIDADFGLEFHFGRPLNQILGKEGFGTFQKNLSELLVSQIKQDHIVITTDASIMCNQMNQDLLSSEFVVYLKVSTEVQLERTSRHPAPLLLTKDLKNFVDELHQERDHLYEQNAKLIINSDDHALEKHVQRIVKIVLEPNDIKSVNDALILDKKEPYSIKPSMFQYN